MGEDLAAFVKPNETLLQLLARTSTEPVLTGLSFMGALRPGHILEAAGPSGCGKTSVLLHVCSRWIQSSQSARVVADKITCDFQIAINAILPKDVQGSLIGGLQGEYLSCIKAADSLASRSAEDGPPTAENVVLIDLDNKFDILRLIQVRMLCALLAHHPWSCA